MTSILENSFCASFMYRILLGGRVVEGPSWRIHLALASDIAHPGLACCEQDNSYFYIAGYRFP